MKYYVERITETGERCPCERDPRDGSAVGLPRDMAIQLARKEAAQHPDDNVFISWGRASDGQQGYLNPDGNHDIEGCAW